MFGAQTIGRIATEAIKKMEDEQAAEDAANALSGGIGGSGGDEAGSDDANDAGTPL